MNIAIVGADIGRFCEAVAGKVYSFSMLSSVIPRRWDLLAVAPRSVRSSIPPGLCASNLLLPGDSEPAIASSLSDGQIIGYGFSPRDTLTLSSFSGEERMLCLQRGLLTLNGTQLEPQELPLPPALTALPEEDALLAAGILLLACEARGGGRE